MNYFEIKKIIEDKSNLDICDIILNYEENGTNIFFDKGKRLEVEDYDEKVKLFKKSREYIVDDIRKNNYDCIIELYSGWGKNIFYLLNEITNLNIDVISGVLKEEDIEIQNYINDKFYQKKNLKICQIDFDDFDNFFETIQNKYKNILFLTFWSEILYVNVEKIINLINNIKNSVEKFKFISFEPCGWQISIDSVTEEINNMQKYGNGYYNILKIEENNKEIIFNNIILDYFGIGEKNQCATLIEWIKYDVNFFIKKKLEPFLFYKYNTRELDNIIFGTTKCKNEGTVLTNTKKYEGETNFYYIIINNFNNIKLYYRACNTKTHDCNLIHLAMAENQYLCYAESYDGINFFKPNLHIYQDLNDNGLNNILFRNRFCHNFFPYYIKHLNKYIGIGGLKLDTNGLFLFSSDDGLFWKQEKLIADENIILSEICHANHFDSLNIILYIEKSDEYLLYLRDNCIDKFRRRAVQYSFSKNYLNFPKCESLKVIGCERNDIYSSGIFIYPETNYFIGLTPILNINNHGERWSSLIISDDGKTYEKIQDNIFYDLKDAHYPCYGYFLKNDKIYIYATNKILFEDNHLICYSYQLNRIGFLEHNKEIAEKKFGTFNSKILTLKDNLIYLNCDSSKGYIKLELYDDNNIFITDSIEISVDNLNYELKWNVEINSEKLYYIKFILSNAKIYSFSYN